MHSLLLLLLLPVLHLVSCTSTKSLQEQSGYIPVEDTRVFYKTVGSGKPLVLVHAGFQDHQMWAQQVKEFTKDYKVILLDMPGHGLTKDGDSAVQASHLFRVLLDSLGIDKASLVGLSLGSAAVMDFALAHPQRVDKVVLTSSAIVGFYEKYPVDSITLTYFPQLKAALDSNNLKRGAEIFTYYWGDSPHRNAQEVNPDMHRYVYETTYKNLQEHTFKQWPQFAQPAAVYRLGELKAPLLILRGDKDLQMIADAGKVLDEQVANSTQIVLKGGGHMLNMEYPKAFNEAVLRFLRQ